MAAQSPPPGRPLHGWGCAGASAPVERRQGSPQLPPAVARPAANGLREVCGGLQGLQAVGKAGGEAPSWNCQCGVCLPARGVPQHPLRGSRAVLGGEEGSAWQGACSGLLFTPPVFLLSRR